MGTQILPGCLRMAGFSSQRVAAIIRPTDMTTRRTDVKQAIFSAQCGFIRGRQLEGTYPGDAKTGIWPITSNRVGRGWGHISEEEWPYDTSVWPPVEPPGLDQIATRNPDFYYQRVRTLEECKLVMARLQSLVMVSLNISD